MMLARVATYALNSKLLDSSLKLQSRMAEKTTQQASGLVSSSYADLDAGDTTRLLNLQSSYSASLEVSSGLSTASSRIDVMYSAVDDMVDLMTELRTYLSSASTSSGSEDELAQEGESVLSSLQQLLNTKYEGRYLFGGTATTSAPVDLSVLGTPSIPSSEDTSYYSGTSDLPSVRLGTDQTITYGTTGNSEAVEKAIRAAKIAATMSTDPVDSDALSEAYDLASEALDGLTVVQASLSISASRVEDAEYREESLQSTLGTSITDVSQVDVAAVATELSAYETQLKASYSSIATVQGLSLLDYL